MNKISTLIIAIGLGTLSPLCASAQKVVMPKVDTVTINEETKKINLGELGIKDYDKLPANALLPITREQAEELITKMIVVSRAPALEARHRAEIVNDFKVEQLKKRLLEQALRQTYADEYERRLDRLENLLMLMIANGNTTGAGTSSTVITPGQGATTTPMTPPIVSRAMPQETVAMTPGATAPSFEHFLSQVFFNFDSSKLTEEGRKVLDNVVGWLAENGNVELSLRGYASPEGKMSYNNKLSARRVNAVADYLLSKGISNARLHVIPSGMDTMKDKKAIYPDARRVDIRPYYGE